MPDIYGRIKRNLTSELLEGASDGTLKKPLQGASQRIHDETDSARRSLSKGAGPGGGFDWSEAPPDNTGLMRGIVRGA